MACQNCDCNTLITNTTAANLCDAVIYTTPSSKPQMYENFHILDLIKDRVCTASTGTFVNGGNNTTVTGSGTFADPFVVNATNTDNQQLTVVDNSNGTVTINLTGDSPSTQPLDVCGIVAANCNATIAYDPVTQRFTFIDNAGLTTIIQLTIPSHNTTCSMGTNIPNPIPATPPTIPAVLVDGSSERVEYSNGYAIWSWNGLTWDVCARDFTQGPIITP